MNRWLFFVALALGLFIFVSVDSSPQKNKRVPIETKDPIHDPARAVANLDVYPGLEATLFAHEDVLKEGETRDIDNGGLTNPTNIDIDHRGRVWVCDVMNYRGNNGKRPKGDRILIYEDTKGEGKADKMTVFYQGRDIDSAMGICVLGNKVIVSAPSNILVFTFDDNDKILKKEFLFTKTGNAQHDHSSHAFVFGPDGRLYWNFGNEGHAVHDKNGKPVVDLAGNVVNDKGKPYRQGMVFRCEMDGSNFATLAWNFRNNYEVCVDSFGTMWQSDNDDDGNRGVRINYVMEYGNFGYVDEMTGAGWQAKRTNMEKDIPLRHWHLNDPGVVPNLLQTGQGSPTGICVYEGNLLPKVFHNQIIHCDAGPSIVRSYPVVPDGAGYKVTQTINILDGNKKNNWFRPVDPRIAPDGSLFVSDWYDPGVGGHGQRDIGRGRIFRVAPPGVKYNVPKANFATIDGNIDALKSPCSATRYIAWTNLYKKGARAEAALLKLYESKIPHERARALWLLGRMGGGYGQHYVHKAIDDHDPNICIVGIRLARQLKLDTGNLVIDLRHRLVKDNMAAVRRECAIALREKEAMFVPQVWAMLARQHDGNDRWYLESLGIGADDKWDNCMYAYFDESPMSAKISKSTRDIIWRSRATRTPEFLVSVIVNKDTPTEELPRLFRAFDFQKDSDIKTAVLVRLAFGDYPDPARRALITGEAINRLKNFDIKSNPKHAEAVNNLLERSKGTTGFVEMVGKFGVSQRYPDLLAMAQKQPTEQIGVDAIRVLLDRDQVKLIQAGLASSDKVTAANTAQALAGAGHDKANALLLPIVVDSTQDLELRRQATRALARNKTGAQQLIKLAQTKKLAKDLEAAAGSALSTATWKDVKTAAEKLFPQPTTKDQKPLPAITDLVKIRGNVASGQAIFAKKGTCANCHVVNGEGKEVGPNLSEIGKKLSREAVFESILYPSASISHNFEMYVVETKQGTSANGLLVSKTPTETSIKGADAIVRTFKASEIDTFARSPISLMPADLHQLVTTQELADVVEYLLTLREAKKGP